MLKKGFSTEWSRERYIKISVNLPGVLPNRMSNLYDYLDQVDRIMGCLLSPERLQGPFLQVDGASLFIYRSAPFYLLTFCLSPELHFEAVSKATGLYLSSKVCKIDGLGSWQKFIRFQLYANLTLYEEGCDIGFVGFAKVVLNSSQVSWKPARWLGEMALEQALDRIERRLRRGLVRDVDRWWQTISG